MFIILIVVISDHVKWEDVSVKYVIVFLFLGTTVIIMLYGVVWVPAQDICDAVELCDSKPSINLKVKVKGTCFQSSRCITIANVMLHGKMSRSDGT